ncbi:hypothetical protein [Tessaracoccus coleopterorum]|uniref:hypothetical protein n=1 Tax=Tessaracoccus coleopterorum TaxID=2714950 RepID=UPI0018D2D0F4|nr:hypothetical protein [Tessaracoccus coleopterorum]
MGKKLILGISAAAMAAGWASGHPVGQRRDHHTHPDTDQDRVPSPGGTTSDGDTRHAGRGDHRGGGMGIDLSALATRLGVDEDRLEAAVTTVRDSTRDGERPTTPPTEAERTARGTAFAKALAAELGLDEKVVTDALDGLRTAAEAERTADQKERLDRAVTDGTLTQAEADAVQKALDEGIVSMRGGRNR